MAKKLVLDEEFVDGLKGIADNFLEQFDSEITEYIANLELDEDEEYDFNGEVMCADDVYTAIREQIVYPIMGWN